MGDHERSMGGLWGSWEVSEGLGGQCEVKGGHGRLFKVSGRILQ